MNNPNRVDNFLNRNNPFRNFDSNRAIDPNRQRGAFEQRYGQNFNQWDNRSNWNNYRHNNWHQGNWGGRYGNNNGSFIGGLATGLALNRFGLGGYYGGLGYGYGPYGYGRGLGSGYGAGFGRYGYVPLGFWGTNRIGYGLGLGLGNYNNPYFQGGTVSSYSYAQPIVTYAETAGSTEAASTSVGMSDFDQARAAFRDSNYPNALSLVERAIEKSPRDAELHEFRALVLFATEQYPQAAEALYGVLSVGPGWNWATMSSLYANVDTYTKQLRALEAARNADPNNAAVQFLLGYHYLATGHPQSALPAFQKAHALQPEDKVADQMVKMLSSETKEETPVKVEEPAARQVPADQLLARDRLIGQWTAKGADGMTYDMRLAGDNTFTWKFGKEGKTQTVEGRFEVDNNVLALEPNAGGALVAGLTKVNDDTFKFLLREGEEKEAIQFTRVAAR